MQLTRIGSSAAEERDARMLRRLGDERHDLIVVGGGVHGAFAAWQAAKWGWRVALLERDDFGSGTSANSLKIAHGGLRYLQTMDIPRLRASVRERAALRALAPALVKPLPCVLPTSGMGGRSRAALALALRANDLLSIGASAAGAVDFPRARTISASEYRTLAGPLAIQEATGAALWYDGLIESPERLMISLVLAAEREGATVLNHAEVVSVLEADGRVSGVRLRHARNGGANDTGADGEIVTVHAPAVLLTAGPWAGGLVPGAAQPQVRACNLVLQLPAGTLPRVAVALPLPRERRMLFAVPWSGRLMVGTSYAALPHDTDPGSALAQVDADLEMLLEDTRRAAPALELRSEDVMLAHAGLLPGTPGEHGAAPLDRSIITDHRASGGPAGLVSVQGVKWTTARSVSRQALEACASSASLVRPTASGMQPDEEDVLVPDADSTAMAARVALLPGRAARGGDLAGRIAARLTRLRGAHAGEILALASAEPALAESLGGSEVVAAEVAHAIRREHARTLADLILRRLELGTAGPPEESTLAAVSRVAAAELGWSAERQTSERASVRALYATRSSGRSG